MNLIWKEILNKTFTGKQKSRSYSNDQNKFDINARIDRAYTLRKKKKFYDIQLSNESRWVCKNNNVQNVSSRDK